jgi:peptidyl-prolyl cis-trans isomerase SurA
MQLRNRERALVGAMVWLALIGGMAGCRRSTTAGGASPEVYAVIDGRELGRDEVEKAYRGVIQTRAEAPPYEEMIAIKLRIVDELIGQDILVARARVLGVEATDTELENAYAERKRGISEEDFQKQLSALGMTTDDIKRALRRELTVQKVIDRDVVSKISISEQEVADFYNQNRDRFNLTEPNYRIAQIVVTPTRDPQLRNRMNDDAGSPAEARRKVNILIDRLRAGAEFSAVAMDYSEDPQTVEQGGDLGFVPVSALKQSAAPLRDAVLKTKPGTYTTVTIGDTYTIVLVAAYEPAGQRELGSPEVRDGIFDLLKGRKAELMRTAYLTASRYDARVTNHLARMVIDGQGKVPGLEPTPPLPAAAPAPPPAAPTTPPAKPGSPTGS